MSSKAILQLQITDFINNYVNKARISLIPKGSTEQDSKVKFKFNKETNLWKAEAISYGEYHLKIKADGCGDQEIKVEIFEEFRSLHVHLAKEGMEFVISGGQKFYFNREKGKLGALVRSDVDAEMRIDYKGRKRIYVKKGGQESSSFNRIIKRRLEALNFDESSDSMKFYSVDISRLRAARSISRVQNDLLKADEVVDFGDLISTDEGGVFLLTNLIELVVESNYITTELFDFFEKNDLKIVLDRQSSMNTIYHLELSWKLKPKLTELSLELSRFPGVQSVDSIIEIEPSLEDFIPGDVNFELQFYHILTRLPKAWEEVDSAKNQESFGSADIVVAVHDQAIRTGGAPTFTPQHDEFKGNVTGGAIGNLPGLDQKKVLLSYDLSTTPMVPGTTTAATHGSWVSGTLLANRDGDDGIVGGAANARLLNYKWRTAGGVFGKTWSECFEHMSGLISSWQRGATYGAANPFPDHLNSGKNPIPYTNVINCSHTYDVALNNLMRNALKKISLMGRNHRGTLVVVAAGNSDTHAALASNRNKWGIKDNVIKVAASSVDVRGEEVRMNYSCYTTNTDRDIDFAAPSASQNVKPRRHEPPHVYGFIAAGNTNTSGDVKSVKGDNAMITNSPDAGTTDLVVSAADYAKFSANDQIVITNTNDRFYSEWHTIDTKEPGNVLRLKRKLGFGYSAGSTSVRILTNGGVVGKDGLSMGFGGTSAAAPQASAIASLMLSVKPELSWLEVRQMMRETAVAINLRYRGTFYAAAANDYRYRWRDGANDLILANGLLDIQNGNKTIPKGGLVKLEKGTSRITLNNKAGLEPKHALLIGAETLLSGGHPRGTNTEINVVRGDEFEQGDTVYIGRNTHSVLIADKAAGDTTIWIQSLDGFMPDDLVSIENETDIEVVKLDVPDRLTAAPAGYTISGPADTGFKIKRLDKAGGGIAGGLRAAFDQNSIVKIARSISTTTTGAAASATVIPVASSAGFKEGHVVIVGTGANAETVRVTKVNTGPDELEISPMLANGNNTAGGLANLQPAGPVKTAYSQHEGPFVIQNPVAGNLLTVDKPVLVSGLDSRHVYKEGTELRAIIRVEGDGLGANEIEIDPIKFDHEFNMNDIEHIRVGRVAGYSFGFGYGRLDGYEAVRAAKAYNHIERDLMLRNFHGAKTTVEVEDVKGTKHNLDFYGDNGDTTTGNQEVESPDLWIVNKAALAAADEPSYDKDAPHEHPQISVDPPVFRGTGHNDMQVSGTFTSAGETTFTIEIDGTANPNTFKWKKDNGAYTLATPITAANIALSDGVEVKFASTTGHTLEDKWIIHARKIEKRFAYVRAYNRGTVKSFEKSAFGASPLNVAESRVLMCLSDGKPVCRFSSIAAAPGPNDMVVTSKYTGAGVAKEKALYTVEISDTSGAKDKFKWWRDGTDKGEKTITAVDTDILLDDGVNVSFATDTGHTVGDRWDIYAWNGNANNAFLNLDHYWDRDEPTPHDLKSEKAGTRIMQTGNAASPTGFSISGLAAQNQQINKVEWLEADRFPTNSPNKAKPTNEKLRLFLLGEVTPHDGKLAGRTPKTNNNISYRELTFAKFDFTSNADGDALETHLDVSQLGLLLTKDFNAEIRTTAGFFEAEKASIKVTAKKLDGTTLEALYHFDGTWKFQGPSPAAWLVLNPPKEAIRPDGTQPVATGEQYDITFAGTLKVDKTFNEVIIESRIGSSYRDLVVAKETHKIQVYPQAPMPTGTGQAKAATLPKPVSHIFADPATLTEADPYGVIDADKFRTTYRFTSTGAVNAYAAVDGHIVLQRDAANNDSVNLILKPMRQALSGFTPVRYFIYRGITLTDYLKGNSGADVDKLRSSAGAIDFVQEVWVDYLKFNAGATDVPADVFGYKSTQNTADELQILFANVGATTQLPFAKKGTNLGAFFTTGTAKFGFEIVLEEGGVEFDLAYARKAENIIDVTGAAANLATRLKREQVLTFIDPAAFYGLHMHTGGKVELPGGANHTGDAIFTNIIDKFDSNKHKHYIDIRSENSDSYNFYGNYKDANDKNIDRGFETGVLVKEEYQTNSWPIVVIDASGPQNTATDRNDYFFKLRMDDNTLPMLHVEHGFLVAPALKGNFLDSSALKLAPADKWTAEIQVKLPNTGPGGAKKGVAWITRLYYGRQEEPVTFSLVPDTILATEKYHDNVFGPIDAIDSWRVWGGTHGLKWAILQDNRYVDADTDLSWSQMMKCGIALQSGAANRALLYATVTDSHKNTSHPFVPIRGMADGVSSKPTFFDEQGLFGVYQLVQDQLSIGGVQVRTLELASNPNEGYPATNAILLGLDKTELDTLIALNANGLDKDYLRNIKLQNEQSLSDANSIPYKKYELAIQGLKTADGKMDIESPGAAIEVYSVDGHFFFSKDFSNAEALPSKYVRNYEEAMGARSIPARERSIAEVQPGNKVVINDYDWSREIVAQDKVKIGKSNSNDGEYTVNTINVTSGNTTLTFASAVNNTAPLGSLYSIPKALEDVSIDLDQKPDSGGTTKFRNDIKAFITDLAGIANNASAKANILAKISAFGPKIYKRAYTMIQANNATSNDFARGLYWARNSMTVAVKEHDFCLASLAGRNELIEKLEEYTRGFDIDLSGGGANHRVLIVAFDPYAIDQNLERNNASVDLGLNLHKQTLTEAGKTAYIETLVLPMRYKELDAGKLETLISPFLAGGDAAKMIVILNQSTDDAINRMHLDRIAAGSRGGLADNNLNSSPRMDLGDDDAQEFYETTLPITEWVPGPFDFSDAQKVYFDESYSTALYTPNLEFISEVDVNNPSNGNAKTYALASINGNLRPSKGSSGNYIPNEVFYRISKLKDDTAGSTTVLGLVTLPSEKHVESMPDLITDFNNLIKEWVKTQ